MLDKSQTNFLKGWEFMTSHNSMYILLSNMCTILVFYCILGMSYSVYWDVVTNETYGGLWQVIVTRLPNALFGLSVTGLCSNGSSQPFHSGQFRTKICSHKIKQLSLSFIQLSTDNINWSIIKFDYFSIGMTAMTSFWSKTHHCILPSRRAGDERASSWLCSMYVLV